MSQPKDVIAIIPARAGSKGLPRKNIADLAGKPLIAYSILAARFSNLINRVIVSTEDEEIAEVAKVWGAEVPFLRPKEYARDDSNMGEAIRYTVQQLGGLGTDKVIVTLVPTSPFRTPAFLDDMLRIVFKGYYSVSAVKEVTMDPAMLVTREEKTGSMRNLFAGTAPVPDWKTYFRPYGVFHAYQTKSSGTHYYHVITDKCMLIDIDLPQDLCFAEAIINNELFDFGF
jgi:CMP-N,N'-diacetyllegionaminic acid synthase